MKGNEPVIDVGKIIILFLSKSFHSSVRCPLQVVRGVKIFGFYILRPLKNLTVSATLQKRMGFYEVTGGPRRARPSRRTLFFRNVSMGEIPPKAGRGQNSPVDMLLKKLNPDPWIGKLKKSQSSIQRYGLCKDLIQYYFCAIFHNRQLTPFAGQYVYVRYGAHCLAVSAIYPAGSSVTIRL
jgi:hypothetical protein